MSKEWGALRAKRAAHSMFVVSLVCFCTLYQDNKKHKHYKKALELMLLDLFLRVKDIHKKKILKNVYKF